MTKFPEVTGPPLELLLVAPAAGDGADFLATTAVDVWDDDESTSSGWSTVFRGEGGATRLGLGAAEPVLPDGKDADVDGKVWCLTFKLS